MISSFFTKTKPINYVVLLVFAGLFYAGAHFFWNRQELATERIWIVILTLIALLLNIFFISELVRQNKVTALSSFAMLFFVVLIIFFPKTVLDTNGVFANLFILLAIKKLLEVKEAKNAKHKIFEAALLVCLASLFYIWAFIYFIAVAFAINTFESRNFKIWLVFLLGVVTFFLLCYMVLIFFGNEPFLYSHYNFLLVELGPVSLMEKLSPKNVIFLIFIIGISLIDFVRLRKKGGGRLVMMRSMLLSFVLGFLLVLFESKEATPILLTFFPASVFLTNLIETIVKKKLRELAINGLIIAALLVFFFENLI